MRWLILLPVLIWQTVTLPGPFVPQSVASVPGAFVSGAMAGETINGSTATALGTQAGTLNSACPTLTYCFPLSPLPNLSGNTLGAFVFYSSSTATTVTVTDDKGDSFTGLTKSSAESSKYGQAFYFCNATAGASQGRIAMTTGVIVYGAIGFQLSGMPSSGCLDGSNTAAAATSTTFAGGSVTPTQTGDVFVAAFLRAGTPLCTSAPCYTAGTGQSGITWALRGVDGFGYGESGAALQWGVYSSTSALNPTITTSLTSTYIGATMAFKVSGGGTSPTGMYPIFQGSYDTPATAASTLKVQYPSTGDLVTAQFTGAGPYITSVTDTGQASGLWQIPGQYSQQAQSTTAFAPLSGIVYAANAVADGVGSLTFNINTTDPGDMTLVVTDWAGAATVPFGSRQITGGNDSTTRSNLTYLSSYLPEMTDGWVLSAEQHANGTTSAMLSPSGSAFVSTSWGGQSVNGPSLPNQNGTWALLHNSAATAQSWEAGFTASVTGGIAAWGAEAASFLSATGSFSGPSVIQSPTQTASSGTTMIATLLATQSGSALVAIVGNQAGSRTVTKICTDGTTCGTGNSFTKVTGATCTNSSLGNEGEIWYLFGHAAGVTAVEATISGTITNSELKVMEIRNISAVDVSGAVNNGAGIANVYTGPSLVFTGSPSIGVANVVIDAATGVSGNPEPTNPWGYDNALYSNTGDASGAVIAPSGTYSYAVVANGATNGFCSSAAAFK